MTSPRHAHERHHRTLPGQADAAEPDAAAATPGSVSASVELRVYRRPRASGGNVFRTGPVERGIGPKVGPSFAGLGQVVIASRPAALGRARIAAVPRPSADLRAVSGSGRSSGGGRFGHCGETGRRRSTLSGQVGHQRL
jgi:hypothetical protein